MTGLVGLPGLTGNQNDPYDPNVDQGVGYGQGGMYGIPSPAKAINV